MAKRHRVRLSSSLEQGICIVCGAETAGIIAQEDTVIGAARKIRRLSGSVRHTVVCREHLPEAQLRRAKFEKTLFGYRLAAGLFFFMVAAGPLAFGKLQLGMVVPGAVGAIFILLISYLQYYPKFTS